MRIRYARAAQTDLRNVSEYGREHWTNTAEASVVTLRDRLKGVLGNHPQAGRKGRVEGAREFVLAARKFVVVYVPPDEAGNLIVLRVLHGAQTWP